MNLEGSIVSLRNSQYVMKNDKCWRRASSSIMLEHPDNSDDPGSRITLYDEYSCNMFCELDSVRYMKRMLAMHWKLDTAEIDLFWKSNNEDLYQMIPEIKFEKGHKTRESTINDILSKGGELYWRFKAKPSDPVAKKEEESKPSDPVAKKKSDPVAKKEENPITKPKTYMGMKGIYIDVDIKEEEKPKEEEDEAAEEDEETEEEEESEEDEEGNEDEAEKKGKSDEAEEEGKEDEAEAPMQEEAEA